MRNVPEFSSTGMTAEHPALLCRGCLLGQAAKISSALSKSDPRSDFMLALKPLLSPGRQKKADEAAMMIKLFGVLGAMREGGK